MNTTQMVTIEMPSELALAARQMLDDVTAKGPRQAQALVGVALAIETALQKHQAAQAQASAGSPSEGKKS